MATVTLDAHRIVKRPKDAGFTDTQAETVTDIIAETFGTDPTDTATRPDLATLAAKADVAAPETKVIKWLAPLLLRPGRPDRRPNQAPALAALHLPDRHRRRKPRGA